MKIYFKKLKYQRDKMVNFLSLVVLWVKMLNNFSDNGMLITDESAQKAFL